MMQTGFTLYGFFLLFVVRAPIWLWVFWGVYQIAGWAYFFWQFVVMNAQHRWLEAVESETGKSFTE